MTDEDFMRLALRQAYLALERGGGEVGSVVTRDGEVLAEAYNEVELQFDPTAHAEVVAMRKCGSRLRSADLRGCTLYTTLQPCGMCTLAAVWANISRIVYGATQHEVSDRYFEERRLRTVDFLRDAYRRDLEVTGGVLADECAKLYSKT